MALGRGAGICEGRDSPWDCDPRSDRSDRTHRLEENLPSVNIEAAGKRNSRIEDDSAWYGGERSKKPTEVTSGQDGTEEQVTASQQRARDGTYCRIR